MNQERFDHLTLSFATTSLSRQQALKRLAASVLSGMVAALGGRRTAAQTDCSEIGSECRQDAECCSDICGRRGRCKCKNAGQSCSEARNCCSEKCCNGRCCGDLQTCDNGRCVCDEQLYETCGATCCPLLTQRCRKGACCTPCGSACCPALTHECRNGACCKQLGVACGGNAQCCSRSCRNGKCAPPTCQNDGECPDVGEIDGRCCQGTCTGCREVSAECIGEICGCKSGWWCEPHALNPTGSCCPDPQPGLVLCCDPGGPSCNNHTQCAPHWPLPQPWPPD